MTELILAHLNLDVGDLARSTEFYETQLALPVERSETQTRVRWPSFLLVLTPGTPRTSANFHFGFRVETTAEVDAWFAKFRERSVTIVAKPERKGSTYVGRIADPDAHVVEIFSFV